MKRSLANTNLDRAKWERELRGSSKEGTSSFGISQEELPSVRGRITNHRIAEHT